MSNLFQCGLRNAEGRRSRGRQSTHSFRLRKSAPTNVGGYKGLMALVCAPGFSLIELLVVVAIMGIVMTICVPFMHNAFNKRKGMNGAVRDVQEACKFARDWAILQQSDHELRIRPHDGVFEVGASSASSADSTFDQPQRLSSVDLSGNEWRMQDNRPPVSTAPAPKTGGGSFSVRLPEGVTIEGLGVNGEDWTEDEVARVRFYPNGTSDEMSIVLLRGETNERRNIWLEVVTGLAEVETDPNKFKAR